MQVLLHTDSHTDGSAAMSDHLEAVVTGALTRFGARVTRVQAYLSDADGRDKGAEDGIHCKLHAQLKGLEDVVVQAHAGSAHEAIDAALRKLKRAVGAEIGRHDPRKPQARPASEASEGPEAPEAADATDKLPA